FETGSAQQIDDNLDLKGASGQLLSLRSTTSGATWDIYVSAVATAAADYLDVKDSTANGIAITATNSVDSGGNTNWTISGPSGLFSYTLTTGLTYVLAVSGSSLELKQGSTVVQSALLSSVTQIAITGTSNDELVLDLTNFTTT